MNDLRETKAEGMKEIIRLYVIKRFDENPELEKEWSESKYEDGVVTRSLDDLIAYIRKRAREMPSDNECVAVEDKVVFGWVNHYLEKEGREEIQGRKEAPKKTEEETEETTEEATPKKEETKPTPTPKPKKAEKKKPEEQGKQLALFSML